MRLPTREVDNHITHTLQLWKRKSVHPCQKSPSNHSRLPTPEKRRLSDLRHKGKT